jgi:hypothetical protein
MNESTISTTKIFTGRASLAAIGLKLKELKVFEPFAQGVQIAQKAVKDRAQRQTLRRFDQHLGRSPRAGRDQ